MIQVLYPVRGLAGGILWPGALEKRSVEHSQLHFPAMVGDGGRENAGILVVHVDEIDAPVRSESRQSYPFPMEQIFRDRQGDSRADGRMRRVGHHVVPERFDERDPGIFAAASAVGASLVISLRFKCDAQALDPARIAVGR